MLIKLKRFKTYLFSSTGDLIFLMTGILETGEKLRPKFWSSLGLVTEVLGRGILLELVGVGILISPPLLVMTTDNYSCYILLTVLITF